MDYDKRVEELLLNSDLIKNSIGKDEFIKLKDNIVSLFSETEDDLIKSYVGVLTRKTDGKIQENFVHDALIMGDGKDSGYRRQNPYVGSDEESFSSVLTKSILEKNKNIANNENVKKVTEQDIYNGLKGIDFIRSLCSSSILINTGDILLLKAKDLIVTDNEGEFYIDKSKVKNKFDSSCIVMKEIKNPLSVTRLNPITKIRLCSSSDFKEFVKIGIIAITDITEIEKINSDWEEIDKNNKLKEESRKIADGTIVTSDRLFELTLSEVDRLGLMRNYNEFVKELEKDIEREASQKEKFWIASEIIEVARKALTRDIEKIHDSLETENGLAHS